MKHIKKFNEIKFDTYIGLDKTDEGLKEWIIAGAIALSSVNTANSQTIKPEQSKEFVSNSSIKINFDKEFSSGVYKADQKSAEAIKNKLGEIAKFIKNNPKKDIVIKVNASESQVPNIDIETGVRLPKNEIANRRANNTKSLIDDFMKTMVRDGKFDGNYKIDTTTKIGDTKFNPKVDSKDDYKFTKEQSVEVIVNATKGEINSDYSAYAKMGERIFLGNKAIGDAYFKIRKTTNINTQGNLDTGHEDFLMKELSNERDFARTGVQYNGKMYLIPSDWWNKNTTTTNLTQAQVDYIKANFEVK